MHQSTDTICNNKVLSSIISSMIAIHLSFKSAVQSLVPSAYLLTPSLSQTTSLNMPELAELYKQQVEALLKDYMFLYSQVSESE